MPNEERRSAQQRRAQVAVRVIASAAVLQCVAIASSTAVAQMPPAVPASDTQPAGAAVQDVLIFTNGDRLTGKLVRGVDGNVVFHSDMAGDLTVPLAKIKELKTAGDFAILRHGAPIRESENLRPEPIVLLENGVVSADTPGAQPLPLKQVAYIVEGETYRKQLAHRTGPLEGWNGTVSLGTTFVQSTQHGGTLSTGAQLVRQVPVLTLLRARNKTTFNVQETYGTLTTPQLPNADPTQLPTPPSTVKTSIFHADAERDEYFRKQFYALATSSFDHNYAQGLQLQQIYGAGIGYTPISTPVQQLDLKADVHYEKQGFVNPATNQNLTGSTFSENYRRTLPRKLVVTQTASVLPAWNNEEAFAAHATAGFVMPVLKRLSLNANVVDDFLRNPSPGYQQNSLQFLTGLAYSLR